MGSGENKETMEMEMRDLEERRGNIEEVTPWKEQITFRGNVASILIGIIYSIIVMKLNLPTGLVPNLNVSAALVAFVFIRTWTKLLHMANFVTTPFTGQQNTIIQTCAVACYSISVGGKVAYKIDMLVLASSLCFCNAYGAGLTDMNKAYNYGKVALFVLAALAGKKDNGVVAALISCGLIKSPYHPT